MCLYGEELLKVTYQTSKFGVDRYCSSADAFSFLRDLARRCEPLMVSHHPAKLSSHRHCDNGDGFSLSRDHARPRKLRAKGTNRNQLFKVSQHPAKFGGHKH